MPDNEHVSKQLDAPCPLCDRSFRSFGARDETGVVGHLIRVHKRTDDEAVALLANPEINRIGIAVMVGKGVRPSQIGMRFRVRPRSGRIIGIDRLSNHYEIKWDDDCFGIMSREIFDDWCEIIRNDGR